MRDDDRRDRLTSTAVVGDRTSARQRTDTTSWKSNMALGDGDTGYEVSARGRYCKEAL